MAISLALIGASLPRPAVAEAAHSASAQAEARRLFDQGVEAGQNDDFGVAVSAFARSFELYPLPGTLLNLGLFQLRAQERPAACATFRDLLARYGSVISEQAREEVRERLATLESELAQLSITANVQGATISINGEDVGRAPLSGPVLREPGTYRLGARSPGFEPIENRSVWLGPGPSPAIELTLTAVPLGLGLDAPPVEPEAPEGSLGDAVRGQDGEPSHEPAPSFWSGPWPWVIVGVVVAATCATVLVLTVPADEPDPDWQVRVP